DKVKAITESQGSHNPYDLHQELGLEMTATCTVVKEEQRLLQGREKVADIKRRYHDLKISDTGHYTNQNVIFARALGDMIAYSEAMLEGSIARKESRGSHYRSDYTERVDDQFHRTSKLRYDADQDEPVLEWEEIPSPLVPLRARTYGKVDAQAGGAEKKEEPVAVGAAAGVAAENQPGGDGYSQQPDPREAMPDGMSKYSGPDGGNPDAK
ncbi:MAG: hypothetical protein AAGL98_06780, partial [Planctomycetota bacterium]